MSYHFPCHGPPPAYIFVRLAPTLLKWKRGSVHLCIRPLQPQEPILFDRLLLKFFSTSRWKSWVVVRGSAVDVDEVVEFGE